MRAQSAVAEMYKARLLLRRLSSGRVAVGKHRLQPQSAVTATKKSFDKLRGLPPLWFLRLGRGTKRKPPRMDGVQVHHEESGVQMSLEVWEAAMQQQ